MIRINLLEKRQTSSSTSSSRPSLDLGGGPALAAAALIVLSIVYVGWRSWSLSSQIGTLQTEVAQADAELKELQDALKLIDTHKTKKDALAKQVQLISELKRRQQVPVHLLDQLSRELPDFLWLEGLQEKGGQVSINGRATTYNAVSNFYNNLTDSPFFADVSLGNTARGQTGVSFSLSCKFVTENALEGAEQRG